eukprot:CAMPEP_0198151748 /NCGR_PEP_ID=MMETSP1443-20131203/56959_1 /TAXON_ID=186043 /ORGANISM="Entomoneis sp., Strain CCMP2396" /LENGTH=279 /DNA_ID=CAMNT_0043817531 /DNA_START=29 /DNA_END=868 /DNA_ORIENTATION=-
MRKGYLSLLLSALGYLLLCSQSCSSFTPSHSQTAKLTPALSKALASASPFGSLYKQSPSVLFSQTEKEAAVEKAEVTSTPIVERPDPAVLLSAQSESRQRFGFVAICITVAIGTYVTVDALDFVEWVLPDGYYELWRDFTWPVPLGLVYLAAGVAHFAMKESFLPMVPPLGTWGGLWQVPAPGADKLDLSYEEYHTYWTGVCEAGGGLLLIIGGLNQAPQVPAFLLFLLTAAVTPANIYMATHDILPPGLPPVPYPLGHFYRGILQCVLLAFFYKLAFQ